MGFTSSSWLIFQCFRSVPVARKNVGISGFFTESRDILETSLGFLQILQWALGHRIRYTEGWLLGFSYDFPMILSSKCWRHGPSQRAFEMHSPPPPPPPPPLCVRYFEYYQGGIGISMTNYRLRLRQNHWKIIGKTKKSRLRIVEILVILLIAFNYYLKAPQGKLISLFWSINIIYNGIYRGNACQFRAMCRSL
jgi:hypothetical protein